MVKLIPIIVVAFTDSYDAGSAARPLYYSNRIESYCFPFGPYSDGVSIKVFGNMIWFFGVLIGDLFVCLLIQISQFQSQLMMLLLVFMVSQVDQVDSYYRLGFHE